MYAVFCAMRNKSFEVNLTLAQLKPLFKVTEPAIPDW